MACTRNQQGEWSQPSFVKAAGASLGAQIGGTKDFFVVLANTREAADTLKQSSMDFGAAASATGGSKSTGVEASTESRPVTIYSQNKGYYAGASLKGGSIKEDADANSVYYSKSVSAADVFSGQVTTSPGGEILIKEIEKFSR